jgi:hypothetical protein
MGEISEVKILKFKISLDLPLIFFFMQAEASASRCPSRRPCTGCPAYSSSCLSSVCSCSGWRPVSGEGSTGFHSCLNGAGPIKDCFKIEIVQSQTVQSLYGHLQGLETSKNLCRKNNLIFSLISFSPYCHVLFFELTMFHCLKI